MPTNDSFQGVSNCYVFKSRLQEYAQKVGMSTPVYDTIKEGPPHEPYFRSSVFVNDVTYNSLPGFFNRKAAEQSAAEVALLELAKTGDVDQSISQPVHETGLCKNLLQEYAQKMNYAIPLYQCQKDEGRGRTTLFQCTIEIGGIRYIGAAAKTKKEAEIKAARTALLAIKSFDSEPTNENNNNNITTTTTTTTTTNNNNNSSSNKPIETTHLTVLPSKKRPSDLIFKDSPTPERAKRGARMKKKSLNASSTRKKKMVKARERQSVPKPQGSSSSTTVVGSHSQIGDAILVPVSTTEEAGPAGKDLNGVSDVCVEKLSNGSSTRTMDGEVENCSSFVAKNLFSPSE